MVNRINIEKLHTDLNAHLYNGDERSEALARRAVRAALQEAMPLYDTGTDEGIISMMNLGVNAMTAWAEPSLKARLLSDLQALRDEAQVSCWQKVGSIVFDEAVMHALSPHLIAAPRSETSLQLYRIEDPTLRQVVPLSAKKSDQVVEISRLLAPHLAADGLGVTDRKLAAAHAVFMSRVQLTEAPTLLGQPDADDYCLHRLTIRPDYNPHLTFPHIAAFIDRLWDKEAFSAWLWGLISGRNKGRQILWISDPRGEGGKSKFFSSLIAAVFGDRISATIASNTIAQKNPHASSAFVGKRLICVGDNNNAWLLLSAGFKELSGDDMLSINPKFVQPFSTRLFCRCVVLSNFVPVILQDQHNKSRTLWIGLEPLLIPPEARDPEYGNHCIRELPQYLAYCERCYAERCVNDYEIQVNERVQRAVALRIAQCESMFIEQFDDWFVLDENGTLPSSDWAKMRRELRLDQGRSDDFRAWVVAKFPQVTERLDAHRPTKWQMEGIRLRRASDTLRAEFATPPSPAPRSRVLEPDPYGDAWEDGEDA